MDLKEFSNLDLSKLPDEIIFLLYNTVHKERSKRLNNKLNVNEKLIKLKNRNHSPKSPYRKAELQELLNSNWDDLFQESDKERKYYVYAHVSKCSKFDEIAGISFNGLPFYIGKGTGNRAFDLKRSEGHRKEIRKLINSGSTSDDIVRIIFDKLTEKEALTIESKLIYFFGTRFDSTKNGILVNLEIPKIPENYI